MLLHYAVGPRLARVLADESDGSVTLVSTPEGDADALRAAIADADVLLHVLEPVTADVIAAAPHLRLVQKLGVGVNTIDLDAARGRGIAVANLPGVNATAVAELTLGLLLAVLRRIPQLDRATRSGDGWRQLDHLPEMLGEVSGRTVGLVGYGAIARRFGAIVDAMGAQVIHHRRDRSAAGWRPLDELLATSDVVSLHLPLNEETRGLLDAPRLATMRRGAILLNSARGPIVDEGALVQALVTGQLAGAGLDVFEQEPIDAASPLLALDNVVLTPHVAWLTADTLERCVRLGIANARRLAANEPILHSVVEGYAAHGMRGGPR
ncbi:MAG: phosphoglycerate dehydrogenase-like oxidoreductase [Ilumatobacteraceae bacterium]|nr:phosphoglycerate dehydrogenase-like oxidoreductase [Ilumatobacteraceae bacterium]